MSVRGRVTAVTTALCVVVVVFSVSGFAQTNSWYEGTRRDERTSVRVLREYTPETVIVPRPANIPPNISSSLMFRTVLEMMLERSETFRRQCQRIANAPELAVILQSTRLSSVGRVRASTRILRTDGRLIATIEVIRLDDSAELIAHEMEHIIEQLDGVDLASKAALSAHGVFLSGSQRDSFETTRAKRVGVAVAAEVRRGGG